MKLLNENSNFAYDDKTRMIKMIVVFDLGNIKERSKWGRN